MASCIGSAMIIAMRSKGTRGEKRIDEARYYITIFSLTPMLFSGMCVIVGALKTPGTGLMSPISMRMRIAMASARARR